MTNKIEYFYDDCGEVVGGRIPKTGEGWLNAEFRCPNCLWENYLTNRYYGKRIECIKCGCTWIGPKVGDFPDEREMYDKQRQVIFKREMEKFIIPKELTKGLILREPWINLILEGDKTWEMRASNIKIRGPISLIQSKTGMLTGMCEVKDVLYIPTLDDLIRHQNKHRVDFSNDEYERYHYAWVIENPKRFKVPIPYTHPKGAVIWVNL